MKGHSVALKAHFASQYSTLATCWRIELRSGTILGFTDHDSDIFLDGVNHLAATGYIASNIQTSDALNVDQGEVQGMLVSPSIIEDDLRAGRWDYAWYEIFRVNWADLTQGRDIQRVGRIGEVSVDRSVFRAELRGLMQAFTRQVGELTSPMCRATFGDARCGVIPAIVTGSVDNVQPDNMTILDATRTEPGPTGSFLIGDVVVQGNRTLIVGVDAAVQVYVGQTVMLAGIVGPDLLNTLQVVTEDVSDTVYTTFYVDVDISDTGIYPGYVSGGEVFPLGSASGFFDYGVLTWLTGANADLSMEVKQYVPGYITLALPMPYAIALGDTYSMTDACDKWLTTCRDRHNNVTNFRGEPYLPGIDQTMQVGRR